MGMYKVIRAASLNGLEIEVSKLIMQNFRPCGGINFHVEEIDGKTRRTQIRENTNVTYFQAMYKP